MILEKICFNFKIKKYLVISYNINNVAVHTDTILNYSHCWTLKYKHKFFNLLHGYKNK